MTEEDHRSPLRLSVHQRAQVADVGVEVYRSKVTRALVAATVVDDDVKFDEAANYARKGTAAIEGAMHEDDARLRRGDPPFGDRETLDRTVRNEVQSRRHRRGRRHVKNLSGEKARWTSESP